MSPANGCCLTLVTSETLMQVPAWTLQSKSLTVKTDFDEMVTGCEKYLILTSLVLYSSVMCLCLVYILGFYVLE